jgi:hypothetical protein
MAVCAAVGALSTFYQDSSDADEQKIWIDDPPAREDADDRGLLVQAQHRPAVHLSAQRPRLRSNFLHMMFATPCEEYESNR